MLFFFDILEKQNFSYHAVSSAAAAAVNQRQALPFSVCHTHGWIYDL